jgi:hypothetical protein
MHDDFARNARGPVIALAALAAGLLPGCASITGTDLQLLSLQASDKNGAPVAGAECRLSNDKGTWHAKTPASPTVLRSAEDLMVNCEAAGQAPGSVRAISRVNAGMAGNLIFGGLVGMVIDHSRGTAYDYPSMIGVVLGASKVIDRNEENAASRPDSSAAAPATAPAQLPASPVLQAAIAADGPNAPAAATLPEVGSRFRYAWTEQQYGRGRQEFDILVTGVNGWTVMEAFSAERMAPARAEIRVNEPAFIGRPLAEGLSLLEFSPYLQSPEPADLPPIAAVSGYPESGGDNWTLSVQFRGREQVTVPAGSFNALKIEVQGRRNTFLSPVASIQSGTARRFEYVVWYVPELKRYARSRHRTWSASASTIGDELIELLEVRAN